MYICTYTHSFCTAEQVLQHFRERFIKEVDANGVVMELLHREIIPQGVRMTIYKTDSPRQQNEILHDRLFRTCTYTALKTVCEVIRNVVGNPKMTLLGKDMMMCLETGQWCYACVVYMHVSVSSMVLSKQFLAKGIPQ